jgi:hypothetical protein
VEVSCGAVVDSPPLHALSSATAQKGNNRFMLYPDYHFYIFGAA